MPVQLSLFPEDPDDDGRRPVLSRTDRHLVAKAIRCLEAVYLTKADCLTSPQHTRDYLKLRLYGLPYEVFVCLFLDNRHRVIRYEELFKVKWTPCPGQFPPEFKLSCPRLSQRFGAAPAAAKRS